MLEYATPIISETPRPRSGSIAIGMRRPVESCHIKVSGGISVSGSGSWLTTTAFGSMGRLTPMRAAKKGTT